jgi:predicted phage-related endonuclease
MRNDLIRKTRLSASEFPAALNMDLFGKTPMALYLEKHDLVEPSLQTPAMRWGQLMEVALSLAYQEDTGFHIKEADTQIHPHYDSICATPDGLIEGQRRGVEFKSVGFQGMQAWDHGIPDAVLIQVAVNMAVFDADCWDVGRLFRATLDWQILTVERDRELEEMLLAEGDAWHRRHILGDEVPALDGSSAAALYLAQKYRKHTDEMIRADETVDGLAKGLKLEKGCLKDAELGVAYHENQLKAIIGGKAGILGSWGKVTWREDKHGVRRFLARFLEEDET